MNSQVHLCSNRTEVGNWLRDAAEYISEHGWTQGTSMDGNGRVCAVGALAATGALAVTETGTRPFLWKDAMLAVAEVAGVTVEGENGIPEWNDAPERTAEEVVLTLKRAAELVDE